MNERQPDWVMIGAQLDNGRVRLLASKELNQAELEVTRNWHDSLFEHVPTAAPVPRYFLTAEMRTYVLIEADDYPTAFGSLFRQWSPESERQAIGEMPQIGGPAHG